MRFTEGGQPALGFHAVAVFDPVSAAVIGSAVIGGGASLLGSSQAADASRDAAGMQDARYNTTRGDLIPYNQTGQNALSAAFNLASGGPNGVGGRDYIGEAYGARPGSMSQAELELTPGYQFDLSQGLKAVQSAAAARGLGVSGASMKGAANFATGLANKTYQDQFNIRQKQFENLIGLNAGQQGNLTNQFSRLNALSTLGENAAAQTGAQGAALANQAGNYTNQAGLASAAGTQGVANALTGSANNYLGYQMLDKLTNRNQGYGTMPMTTSGYTPNLTNQIENYSGSGGGIIR